MGVRGVGVGVGVGVRGSRRWRWRWRGWPRAGRIHSGTWAPEPPQAMSITKNATTTPLRAVEVTMLVRGEVGFA